MSLSVSLNLASWARGLGICLGLLLWVSTPAHALQIEVKPLKLHTGVEVSALHLSGSMVEGDGESVEVVLRQPKKADG